MVSLEFVASKCGSNTEVPLKILAETFLESARAAPTEKYLAFVENRLPVEFKIGRAHV